MTSKLRRFLLSGMPWLCAMGCAGRDRSDLTLRTDSAGVEIVEYGGGDRQLGWTFVREFVLGGKDSGPESFYRLSRASVKADSLGRIYVLHGEQVTAFSTNGSFLWSAGRKGAGPGEMDFAAALAVAPEGLVSVYDFAKRALVRFDAQGVTMEQVPISVSFFGGNIHDTGGAIVLPDQRLVTSTGVREERLVQVAGDSVEVVFSMDAAETREINLPNCGMRLSGMPPVFTPTLRWAASGERLAVVWSAEYAIWQFDRRRLYRILRRRLEPTPATEAAAMEEIGGGMRIMTGTGLRTCPAKDVVAERGIAEVIPVIERIALGPDGHVWIERLQEPESALVDIIATDGTYVGTLPAHSPFPVVFLPGDRIGAIETDDLDVDRLVVYLVRRGE